MNKKIKKKKRGRKVGINKVFTLCHINACINQKTIFLESWISMSRAKLKINSTEECSTRFISASPVSKIVYCTSFTVREHGWNECAPYMVSTQDSL
jgi:hypothetical protein